VRKKLPEDLPHPREPAVRLRLATRADRETLRVWKNANKRFFFLQEDITPAQQEKWFEGYLLRPDDHQYMIEETTGGKTTTVGVLAARLLDDGQVDIYNVMRGQRTEANLANMGEAMHVLCGAVQAGYPGLPVTCKVLDQNPAATWYERLGFVRREHASGHFLLRYEGKGLT
jgi:hypothetical protein